MISIDDKAFQSVTLQTSTLFYNFITCFSSYVYNFVTVTVCKCMGAVKWCTSFSEFPYSASGITLVYEKAKWKEGKFYCGTQHTEASLQKAGKYDDSWVRWILGRYFLINHCIILFEIMLISINKFNTVCIFCCFPERSSCDRIPWWMQAFCVIEPLRWDRWEKEDPVILL